MLFGFSKMMYFFYLNPSMHCSPIRRKRTLVMWHLKHPLSSWALVFWVIRRGHITEIETVDNYTKIAWCAFSYLATRIKVSMFHRKCHVYSTHWFHTDKTSRTSAACEWWFFNVIKRGSIQKPCCKHSFHFAAPGGFIWS